MSFAVLSIGMECCNYWGRFCLWASFSVSFPAPNDSPGLQSTGKLLFRWKNRVQWSDWLQSSRHMNSVVFSALWTCERSCTLQSKGWRISWDVLVSVRAAGKIVWTGGLWSCSNLNLKKLVVGNKETMWTGMVFDGSDRSWAVQNYCHAGSSVLKLILTLAVLQLYSTGDTCVLANPDCWHFHQGCHGILCWLMSLILTRAEHCHLNGAGTASSAL